MYLKLVNINIIKEVEAAACIQSEQTPYPLPVNENKTVLLKDYLLLYGVLEYQ